MTAPEQTPAPKVKHKASHVGAPAIFLLERECQQINDAFGDFGCYLVGSSLEKPDWRDVDVRFIMEDDTFHVLFPAVQRHAEAVYWENDPRWLLINSAISAHLSRVTGLPVDFQIWPQTMANKLHGGERRDALGMRMAPVNTDD